MANSPVKSENARSESDRLVRMFQLFSVLCGCATGFGRANSARLSTNCFSLSGSCSKRFCSFRMSFCLRKTKENCTSDLLKLEVLASFSLGPLCMNFALRCHSLVGCPRQLVFVLFLFCGIEVLFSASRIFLSDVGNFSFWSDDESRKYKVNYGGKEWTGYWSWCAALNRAVDVSNRSCAASWA